jgi:uncharacterized protein YcbX
LTQRAAPALATVRPVVDLAARTLTLWPPPMLQTTTTTGAEGGRATRPPALGPLVVPLPENGGLEEKKQHKQQQKMDPKQPTAAAAAAAQGEEEEEEVSVCGELAAACGARARATTAAANDGGQSDDESAWWRAVTGLEGCRLVALTAARAGAEGLPLSFANEGQLLVVNEASVAALEAAARARAAKGRRQGVDDDGGAKAPPTVDWARFRPNVVLSGFPAWAEDGWATLNHNDNGKSGGRARAALRVGGRGAELVALAPCARCDLVRVDQRTGRRGGAGALAALADPQLRAARRREAAAMVVAAASEAIAGGGAGDGVGGGGGGVGGGGVGGGRSDFDPSSGIAFGVLASSFACWRRWVEQDGEEEGASGLGMTTMTPLGRPSNATVGGAGGAPAAAANATRAADADGASGGNPPLPPARRCPGDPGSSAPGVKSARWPPAIAVGDAVEVVVR